MGLKSLELCAGAGGQAIGLEAAGFEHVGLVELDEHCCETLRRNRPRWNTIQEDLNEFAKRDLSRYEGVDLLAGGLPCPPFSRAGKQLGEADERNLFPAALKIVKKVNPRAIFFENVRGLMDKDFDQFRARQVRGLKKLGYEAGFFKLQASDFGVAQLRPRVVLVALKEEIWPNADWSLLDAPPKNASKTVGEELLELMSANGWEGARGWAKRANTIAPTIVGGSLKHGGPDLGPTRAKRQWEALGVNGHTIAEEAPEPGFTGNPRLTVKMVAKLQGFPGEWAFSHARKTAAYRQVGNAFPAPVAQAVGSLVYGALEGRKSNRLRLAA